MNLFSNAFEPPRFASGLARRGATRAFARMFRHEAFVPHSRRHCDAFARVLFSARVLMTLQSWRWRRLQHTRHFGQDKEEVVRFWLHKLMLSALYQDLIAYSDLPDWQQQTTAPARLYLRYSPRTTLAIPGRPTLSFDEVLLPVRSNSPEFIYLRLDDTVMRMAKYDAWTYVKLATEAGLPVHPTWLTVERGDW